MSLTFFLSGITLTTFAFSGIFFLKYWKASKDKFFLFFCYACSLLAIERAVILYFTHQSVSPHQAEISVWVYMIRLLAFGLILTAVVVKNKES